MFILRDPETGRRPCDALRPTTRTPLASPRCSPRCLSASDILTQHYDVRICYYEDFRKLTARYVNDLLAWTGTNARIRPAAAAELAARDAQEGSVVSRASVGEVPEDPAFREAFRDEWRAQRPAAMIERLRLRGL